MKDSDVHLWIADLDRRSSETRGDAGLSPDERMRAERIRSDSERSRFVAARAFLREILGQYLHQDPADVRFQYGSRGKPRLDKCHAATQLHFNLSHSGGRAALGVTRAGRIGVDIEWIERSTADLDRLAARFFCKNEYDAIRRWPRNRRRRAFFACWTLKEAFLKAGGDGLATPLNQFEVAFGSGETPRLVQTAWDPAETGRWSLSHVHPERDFIAAVCVEGRDRTLTCRPP